MSDDSIDESIMESIDDFEDESLAQTQSKSHATSKAENSPPSSGGSKDDLFLAGSNKTYHLEESLEQSAPQPQQQDDNSGNNSVPQSPSRSKESVPPSPSKDRTESKGSRASKDRSESKDSRASPKVSSAPGSKTGSKEVPPQESKAEESKAEECNADESTSKTKVPPLALTERVWRSAGGQPCVKSAKDHLMRSNDARLLSLWRPFTERAVVVRDPSPTFASARKIPRGLLKKMEAEKRSKEEAEGEDSSSATSAVASSKQPPSPKSKRKHLLYTMPEKSTNSCWSEINRDFRPFMLVNAEYTTAAGKKVKACGHLLSGWEVPKSRLREGPHARPPYGREPPTAKAVTTLPLVEKARSEKFVRVMLHDGVEMLLPRNKVSLRNADIFR